MALLQSNPVAKYHRIPSMLSISLIALFSMRLQHTVDPPFLVQHGIRIVEAVSSQPQCEGRAVESVSFAAHIPCLAKRPRHGGAAQTVEFCSIPCACVMVLMHLMGNHRSQAERIHYSTVTIQPHGKVPPHSDDAQHLSNFCLVRTISLRFAHQQSTTAFPRC